MLNDTLQYALFSVNDFAVSSLEYIASSDWWEEIINLSTSDSGKGLIQFTTQKFACGAWEKYEKLGSG